MRSMHKLKPLDVEKRLSKQPGLHSDGGGLCLRVSSAAARSWVYRFMLNGLAREMGLGAYPEISLSDARGAAGEARKLKAQGIDPIAAREAVRAQERLEAARAVTFRQCAEAFIEAHKGGWKNAKHAQQWSNTLETYAMPIIGNLPVQAIDVALIDKVLSPIWSTKTETASRVRGRIESILDWATTRGHRQGENPARWRGHLENLFPARTTVRRVKHHAALPFAQLPAFMTDLQQQEGLGALALQFTILTAARTEETIGLNWAEIDIDKGVWTLPAERMKAKREHRVPLSEAALDILKARREVTAGVGFVFPGAKRDAHLSNMAMLVTLRRMGRGHVTVHGFRSVFRDWVEECTNFAGSVAEAALAHVVGDKVEAAYRRGDLFEKRRKLMAAWAAFCMTPIEEPKVVPITKRAG
jgi:integrase